MKVPSVKCAVFLETENLPLPRNHVSILPTDHFPLLTI